MRSTDSTMWRILAARSPRRPSLTLWVLSLLAAVGALALFSALYLG